MSALLSVADLRVSFTTPRGTVHALRGVDLEIPVNKTVCVIGESGSGKSVTGRAIMGLLPSHSASIDSGRIEFDGKDLTTLPERNFRSIRGSQISMIFQDPSRALNPTMRIGAQIAEAIKLHEPDTKKEVVKERVIDLLHSVRLPGAREHARQYPHELSGGMRQRVAIAMALACDPRLVIADEPTTALDVTTQVQILDLLKTLQEERGMSVMLITHDMGVASHYADAVSVMYAGRIVEAAPTDVLFGSIRMPYTEGLLKSVPSLSGTGDKLESIPGGPPDLRQTVIGCSFAPRCPRATEKCQSVAPEPVEVGTSHVYECWHPLGGSDHPQTLSEKEATR